jgi:hypothetical protein
MRSTHRALADEIQAAGFYVYDGGWRIMCCSTPKSGKSFWVAEICGQWYVGVCAPRVYRIPDADRVAACCLSRLRDTTAGIADFPKEIKYEYNLLMVADWDDVDDWFEDNVLVDDRNGE